MKKKKRVEISGIGGWGFSIYKNLGWYELRKGVGLDMQCLTGVSRRAGEWNARGKCFLWWLRCSTGWMVLPALQPKSGVGGFISDRIFRTPVSHSREKKITLLIFAWVSGP